MQVEKYSTKIDEARKLVSGLKGILKAFVDVATEAEKALEVFGKLLEGQPKTDCQALREQAGVSRKDLFDAGLTKEEQEMIYGSSLSCREFARKKLEAKGFGWRCTARNTSESGQRGFDLIEVSRIGSEPALIWRLGDGSLILSQGELSTEILALLKVALEPADASI